MLEALLLTDVTPLDTTISLVGNGAIALFSTTGGTVYFDDDYFNYTSIDVPTSTFLGVTCLGMQHLAATQVYPNYGYLLTDIIAALEKSPSIDSEGVMTELLLILDEATKDVLSAQKHLRSIANPVLAHPGMLEAITKSLGMEYNPARTEGFQRMLAMFSASGLKERGNLGTFKYLAWLLCGYDLAMTMVNSLVPFTMNDTYGAFCLSPQELLEEPATIGLWRFSGVAPQTTVDNELAPGVAIESIDISSALAWSTDSMFAKDSSVDLIPGVVPGHQLVLEGAIGTTFSVHKRTRFAVELWFKTPDIVLPAAFPVNILEKDGVFSLYWSAANEITLGYTTPLGTTSQVFSDALVPGEWTYFAFIYSPTEISFVRNDEVLSRVVLTTLPIEDSGNDWVFGGASTGNDALGSFDMFRLSFGAKSPIECLNYYDHIRKLRLVGTTTDEYTYFYIGTCEDGLIDIEVSNDDGSPKNHSLLRYLCDEYLEAGDINIRYVGHLLAEHMIHVF